MEHTDGFKAIAVIIIKPLLAGLVALGWWPTTDFIILQMNDYVFLSPISRIIMEEARLIFGVLISAAVFIKIILGIVNYKKEKK